VLTPANAQFMLRVVVWIPRIAPAGTGTRAGKVLSVPGVTAMSALLPTRVQLPGVSEGRHSTARIAPATPLAL
jgi:hypothetical protein